MPDINLSGFDNEDIVRQFTLKTGDENSSVAYNLTGLSLEADIRDDDNTLVLRLTSNESDHRITISDPTNGVFVMTIAQGLLAFVRKRVLRYDLLLRSGSDLRRLWGGRVTVNDGITTP